MVRLLLLVYFGLCCLNVGAQDTTKGVSIRTKTRAFTGTTRAVVVGISKYQQYDSLYFADKDALEFVRWMETNNEWNIQDNNVQVLLNEAAKAGDIITWLNWLLEQSKPGDQAVFFFSGHGNVETSTDANEGYLLAHDSPLNHFVTGAVSVSQVQDLCTRFAQKDVRIYLVIDACRSGHLAGGASGTRLTAEAFNKLWEHETKMLSCNPGQYSVESNRWGGGRGVFSFYLTKGLSGYADRNGDSTITVAELSNYVRDAVNEQTYFAQQPIFKSANEYTANVSRANRALMEWYAQWDSPNPPVSVTQKKKGTPLNIPIGCQRLYNNFLFQLRRAKDTTQLKIAMAYHRSLQNSCADTNVINDVRYRLTAVMMNYVQEVVNHNLSGEKLAADSAVGAALWVIDQIYSLNERKPMLQRAHLDNIATFLRVVNRIFWSDAYISLKEHEEMTRDIDKAFVAEPDAGYLHLTKGILYASRESYDTASWHYSKVIEQNPTSMMGYYYLSMVMSSRKRHAEAIDYMKKIDQIDSNFRKYDCRRCFLIDIADNYWALDSLDQAANYYNQALAYGELPAIMLYLAEIYAQQKNKTLRDEWLGKAAAISRSVSEQLYLLEFKLDNKLINSTAASHLLDSLEVEATAEDMKLLTWVRLVWAKQFRPKKIGDYYEVALDTDPLSIELRIDYMKWLVENRQLELAEDILDDTPPQARPSVQSQLDFIRAVIFAYTERKEVAVSLLASLLRFDWITCDVLSETFPVLKKLSSFKQLLKECRK